MDQGWDNIEIDALVRPVIEGGDHVHQVLLSDRLLDLVSELEAETHDEDGAMTRRDAGRRLSKYALTSRKGQTLDWFFDGVLARRGVFELNGEAFIRVTKALGKEVIEDMQSVIDSRVAWTQIDVEELEAAAAEKDSKAFWLYVDGPTNATETLDFTGRVWPAVRDLELNEEDQAAYRNSCGTDAPATKTFTDVMEYVGLSEESLA